MQEIMKLTALQLGAAIRRGEVSPTEAVKAALERIEETAGDNAFTEITAERALERAAWAEKELAAGRLAGPLAGVPMALKDNICTRGVSTTCASRILAGFRPPYDATLVERLEGAGAVSLGKLNMDEFAMGSTSETSFLGPVRNPWDRERVPGGSSGGAAAAVAARSSWYAIGSDTGGSIRQPAAFCGVTGIKPTYGTVSRYGLIAYASSLDQMGPLARDAADCAAVLDAIQGKDPRDGTCLDAPAGGLLASLTGDVRGMRIGLPADCYGEGLDPEVRRAVLEAAGVLEGFLQSEYGWVENKITACQDLSACYLKLEEEEKAAQALFRSFLYDRPRAEVCCDIGRYFLQRRRYEPAVYWYKAALECRRDAASGGFFSPDCYDFIPYLQLCVCYDRMGDLDQAFYYHKKSQLCKPENPSVLYNEKYFESKRKEREAAGGDATGAPAEPAAEKRL